MVVQPAVVTGAPPPPMARPTPIGIAPAGVRIRQRADALSAMNSPNPKTVRAIVPINHFSTGWGAERLATVLSAMNATITQVSQTRVSPLRNATGGSVGSDPVHRVFRLEPSPPPPKRMPAPRAKPKSYQLPLLCTS